MPDSCKQALHLVDTTMFFCARGGGVKRYLLSKRAWLAAHAPNVRHSLLFPGKQRSADGLHACAGMALALPDGYRLPLDFSRWYRSLLALQPQLIEAADPYIPAWAARQAAQQLSIPCIAFYHSDLPRMLAQRVGHWIEPVARSYLRRLYSGFDMVLAPSRVMHSQLVAAGISHAALQPLGVDIAMFHPQAREPLLRARLGLPSQARLLVYAGRFSKEKHLDVLMQTVRRLGDPYHLLLIGGRRRHRPAPRVTILPYQRSTQLLARLMASCDVFVHAGDQETYGLVAAEALACGLPVVSIAQGAMPELVDEAVGALAQAVSASLLAAAIDGIYQRDLPALQRAARARALARHSWDCTFRSMVNRYTTLVARASMPVANAAAVRA